HPVAAGLEPAPALGVHASLSVRVRLAPSRRRRARTGSRARRPCLALGSSPASSIPSQPGSNRLPLASGPAASPSDRVHLGRALGKRALHPLALSGQNSQV